MKHSFYLFILLCSVSLILALSLNPYGFCVGVTSEFNGHDILRTYFLFSFDGGVKGYFLGFVPLFLFVPIFLGTFNFSGSDFYSSVCLFYLLLCARSAHYFPRNIFWSFPVRASRVFFISGSYPWCASYYVYCTGIASNSHTPPSIRCSPRWAPNSSMYFVSYGVVSYFSFVYINYTIQNTLHMLVIGSDALNVIYYLG